MSEQSASPGHVSRRGFLGASTAAAAGTLAAAAPASAAAANSRIRIGFIGPARLPHQPRPPFFLSCRLQNE